MVLVVKVQITTMNVAWRTFSALKCSPVLIFLKLTTFAFCVYIYGFLLPFMSCKVIFLHIWNCNLYCSAPYFLKYTWSCIFACIFFCLKFLFQVYVYLEFWRLVWVFAFSYFFKVLTNVFIYLRKIVCRCYELKREG